MYHYLVITDTKLFVHEIYLYFLKVMGIWQSRLGREHWRQPGGPNATCIHQYHIKF